MIERTALSLGIVALLTACPSDRASSPKDAGLPDVARDAGSVVESLRLTTQVTGWVEEDGSYVTFDASTLFDLINGGAQPHLDRGMVAGITQTLTRADRRAEVFAEDFGTAANAKTMYAFAEEQVAEPLSLAAYPAAAKGDAVLGGAVFHALFDRYYFKLTLTGYTTADRQALLGDAEAFVAAYEALTTKE